MNGINCLNSNCKNITETNILNEYRNVKINNETYIFIINIIIKIININIIIL